MGRQGRIQWGVGDVPRRATAPAGGAVAPRLFSSRAAARVRRGEGGRGGTRWGGTRGGVRAFRGEHCRHLARHGGVHMAVLVAVGMNGGAACGVPGEREEGKGSLLSQGSNRDRQRESASALELRWRPHCGDFLSSLPRTSSRAHAHEAREARLQAGHGAPTCAVNQRICARISSTTACDSEQARQSACYNIRAMGHEAAAAGRERTRKQRHSNKGLKSAAGWTATCTVPALHAVR